MKGLLLKDFYTLVKQMKLFLLMLVCFSLIPHLSVTSFAIVYAALLPVTALAYDERSKWDRLAAMMPYSLRSLVLSKYLLGYAAVGGAALLSAAAQAAVGAVKGQPFAPEGMAVLLAAVCVGALLLAVDLPFVFRMGVEKGRFIFLILTVLTAVASMTLRDWLAPLIETAGLHRTAAALCIALFTVLANAVSAAVAVRQYARRRR